MSAAPTSVIGASLHTLGHRHMKKTADCTTNMIEAALKEDGRFECVKMLGKGSFGCVVQARILENDEIVAVKLLPRSEVGARACRARCSMYLLQLDLLLLMTPTMSFLIRAAMGCKAAYLQ